MHKPSVLLIIIGMVVFFIFLGGFIYTQDIQVPMENILIVVAIGVVVLVVVGLYLFGRKFFKRMPKEIDLTKKAAEIAVKVWRETYKEETKVEDIEDNIYGREHFYAVTLRRIGGMMAYEKGLIIIKMTPAPVQVRYQRYEMSQEELIDRFAVFGRRYKGLPSETMTPETTPELQRYRRYEPLPQRHEHRYEKKEDFFKEEKK